MAVEIMASIGGARSLASSLASSWACAEPTAIISVTAITSMCMVILPSRHSISNQRKSASRRCEKDQLTVLRSFVGKRFSGPPRMVLITLDRRRLLRHGAALAGALPLLTARGRLARAQLPPRRVFFENSDYADVRLSPDGQHLAYLAPVDRVHNLWVAPAASPERGQPLTRARDR